LRCTPPGGIAGSSPAGSAPNQNLDTTNLHHTPAERSAVGAADERVIDWLTLPLTYAERGKAWASLSAGALVVIGAGLITGSTAVWIFTGIPAVTAALNTCGQSRTSPRVSLVTPGVRAARSPAPQEGRARFSWSGT
jgi:hypothetical protein